MIGLAWRHLEIFQQTKQYLFYKTKIVTELTPAEHAFYQLSQ